MLREADRELLLLADTERVTRVVTRVVTPVL